MKWATREHMHIDRAACAWLITRFIDADAQFIFVADPADVPTGATAFDMRGAEHSHQGADCTFETILRRHELADPVLWKSARSSMRPTSTMAASTQPAPRPRRLLTK
ncbi:chromate resistance protein ChrB domain-containing protein [Cryobacterium sp. Hh11]|uniref:chromate resistance protein ChrB domain-containing protein n=1 Tax=Cryobacterium sp. Hh11 TaxID=2555868 RepID=UPI001F53FC61|nr:chromate resistance protein ChrB domain-containing protein [Cryobacterium sp. Hh11]